MWSSKASTKGGNPSHARGVVFVCGRAGPMLGRMHNYQIKIARNFVQNDEEKILKKA